MVLVMCCYILVVCMFVLLILTLLPDVSLFEHGVQEDHVTEGRTLQDHSLALNTEDQDIR